MAATRVTIDALREQVARIEADIGTQVSRLDADIGTTAEANTTLATQLVEAFLLLGLQRELMETRRKAVEERIETLHDKMRSMAEEFEEQKRSLEGEIVLLKRAMVQAHHLPRILFLQRCEYLSPSLLVALVMPKTRRTSSRTWNNTSLLPEYLLVNK